MPLLQTSGNVTADGYGGGVAAVPNYIEDVFSTYLYTGNGSTQTITNGIDLSTKGGLVWFKSRSGAYNHALIDTARGGGQVISSNTTSAQADYSPQGISAFNTNGFTFGTTTAELNNASNTYASWTFRKQPKFFDVVTWTGDNSDGRFISHSLGSTPGMVIIKNLTSSYNWVVWHKDLANPSKYLVLNSTAATATDIYGPFGSYSAGFTTNASCFTSTGFYVAADARSNLASNDYVAYVFAHDAGGFGLTGTDNVISCGSYTTDGSGYAEVNLGYEPQFILRKSSSTTDNWFLMDNMRGLDVGGTSDAILIPNTSGAEVSGSYIDPTATGFIDPAGGAASRTFIYIAIRRGPMKVPTDGTSVFSPNTATYSANQVVTTGFPVDMLMMKGRTITFGTLAYDRLRGLASTNTSPVDPQLITSDTSAETSGDYVNTANNTGYQISPGFSGFSSVNWNFRRAPSFFDEVCYTGTGSNTNFSHNLGVAPQLIILKNRVSATNWFVPYSGTSYMVLNGTSGGANGSGAFDLSLATASTFWLGADGGQGYNGSGQTYVAYLFATCAGVSKVGSYTGNGSTQTINCGFTSGARFVLIKRTDSTGDWYVYDTARGMTTLTDPYLLLNSTAAESATLGSVTTVSTGFAVNASILAAINTNGASYIFLAIA